MAIYETGSSRVKPEAVKKFESVYSPELAGGDDCRETLAPSEGIVDAD